MTDLLRVKDISHRYKTIDAVKDVSLSIAAGQVHGLLGQSGSGKSTLLRVIAGLETPIAGSVCIDSVAVCDASHFVPAEKRPVGFVFQDYALFPHLSVIKNVMFGMSGGSRTGRRDRARSLLESVDLASSADLYPHTLSGGQQQRVALVRALAREPSVMLLDEPFSGLDPSLRSDVREMTMQVLRQAGVATLLVTHDPLEALATGDRVSVIHEGRITQSDLPNRIVEAPIDEPTRRMFTGIHRIEDDNTITFVSSVCVCPRPEQNKKSNS